MDTKSLFTQILKVMNETHKNDVENGRVASYTMMTEKQADEFRKRFPEENND